MKLENLTFRGGTHMKDFKELSSGSEIRPMPAPGQVILTLSQHVGAPAKCLVKKGDAVAVGQKIAEAGGFVSAPVHSSVSGTVHSIIDYLTVMGTTCQAVVIENDGLDTVGYEKADRSEENLTAKEIVSYIQEAGIVGMGGAGFPTHVKLTPPEGKVIDAIIVNAAECEPYLTCDDVTMRTTPEKVVRGLKIAMKAVNAPKGYIAIEDNKPKAIEAIEKAAAGDPAITVAVLKTKYPQGDEKQIIYAVTGKEVPFGGLPADVGIVVSNTGTVCAIVDAVCYGKPLYERVVTVTGHGVNKPQNLLVRFGTKIKDIVEYSGGYAGEPGKIIFGGPMMGVSQYTDEAVTDKRNNGILVLTKEESAPKQIEPCMRCGRCVDVCPMHLEPLYIASLSKAERFDLAQDYYITHCIECGACSFICPSQRPLTEYIRFGKREIRALSAKKN